MHKSVFGLIISSLYVYRYTYTGLLMHQVQMCATSTAGVYESKNATQKSLECILQLIATVCNRLRADELIPVTRAQCVAAAFPPWGELFPGIFCGGGESAEGVNLGEG